jgi:hypothetical protein
MSSSPTNWKIVYAKAAVADRRQWVREYALAVAAETTGSTRPED